MNSFQSSQEDMLNTLNDAVLAIAEGLSLPRTLQRIADTARALINCKYAALGVLSDDGSQLKQFITSGIEPQRARLIQHEPEGKGLLGNIFKTRSPIRVDHIATDDRSAGFCDNHPTMDTFLGVPIMNRGNYIGNLYLCDRNDGQPFDKRDEDLLLFLANHAAIAIDNARLHTDLQATALRSERDRIGMELHDGVIQSIYAVGMKIEILQSKLELNPQQSAKFQTIMDDLNHIIDDIRAYIRNLISAREEQATFRTYVNNIVTHFRDFSGIAVTTEIAEDMPVLSDFQRHNLLQILREALANVAHHANATEVTLSIKHIGRDLVMSVADDGDGFEYDPTHVPSSNHFGLGNIEQRVNRLYGSMFIDTSPNKGTVLSIKFTLQPA